MTTDYNEEAALAEAEGEAYAEFGMSWVRGGGRPEDIEAAWAAHRRSDAAIRGALDDLTRQAEDLGLYD